MPRWVFDRWFDLNVWVQGTAFSLGSSLRTEGVHHIPRHGPALLIANHQSFLDPSLIGVAARRPLCYLARKTLFTNRLFAMLLRSLNGVPVDQEGIGIEGLRLMLQKLREGNAVMVFPEGNRTWDGKIQPLMPGIHLLIKRAPAPIIPVGIAGAFEAWPRWRAWPTPAPLFLPTNNSAIAVSVGHPIDARRFDGMPREAVLTNLSAVLQGMLNQAHRLRRK